MLFLKTKEPGGAQVWIEAIKSAGQCPTAAWRIATLQQADTRDVRCCLQPALASPPAPRRQVWPPTQRRRRSSRRSRWRPQRRTKPITWRPTLRWTASLDLSRRRRPGTLPGAGSGGSCTSAFDDTATLATSGLQLRCSTAASHPGLHNAYSCGRLAVWRWLALVSGTLALVGVGWR